MSVPLLLTPCLFPQKLTTFPRRLKGFFLSNKAKSSFDLDPCVSDGPCDLPGRSATVNRIAACGGAMANSLRARYEGYLAAYGNCRQRHVHVMHQPQVDNWTGNRIDLYAAVEVKTAAKKESNYGVVWFHARTGVDKVNAKSRSTRFKWTK